MMKNNVYILIITNKNDITVDFIINLLNKKKIKYFRFNTEDIGSRFDVNLKFFDNQFYVYDRLLNKLIDLDEIYSIYFRRPQIPFPPEILSTGEKSFYMREYNYLLDGLFHYLENKKWLNNIFDIRRAENKIYQILEAKKINLNIPPSIITNNPPEALKFIKKNKMCIFKSIRYGFIEEENKNSKILYTTEVDDSFINNIDRIKKMPFYLQKKIKKKSDIRVTIVNNQIFAAEILSQNKDISKTDWRKSSEILPHQKIELPTDIKTKCLKLCSVFNLKFAAIDLILDSDNKFWFLEINPNGQWAWIEKILNYPISQTIVEYLIK